MYSCITVHIRHKYVLIRMCVWVCTHVHITYFMPYPVEASLSWQVEDTFNFQFWPYMLSAWRLPEVSSGNIRYLQLFFIRIIWNYSSPRKFLRVYVSKCHVNQLEWALMTLSTDYISVFIFASSNYINSPSSWILSAYWETHWLWHDRLTDWVSTCRLCPDVAQSSVVLRTECVSTVSGCGSVPCCVTYWVRVDCVRMWFSPLLCYVLSTCRLCPDVAQSPVVVRTEYVSTVSGCGSVPCCVTYWVRVDCVRMWLSPLLCYVLNVWFVFVWKRETRLEIISLRLLCCIYFLPAPFHSFEIIFFSLGYNTRIFVFINWEEFVFSVLMNFIRFCYIHAKRVGEIFLKMLQASCI
jgi:hypothetical protein